MPILFDCDGVLVDTERDGHRVSFNRAFAARGLTCSWDVERYGKLLEIAGGKERMTAYFQEVGWPVPENQRKDFIQELHHLKTDLFMSLIEEGALPLRPGVARLIDEAIAAGHAIAICSTSNERAVTRLVEILLGAERRKHIRIFAGDVVKKKKPAPDIYLLALKELNLDPAKTVVVEDSAIGFQAASAAGLRCLVTRSAYTQTEDFTGAWKIQSDLDHPHVTIKTLFHS